MRRDIWIFLFFLGFLLFNWPFLAMFQAGLPTYLFVIWLLFIGMIFVASILTGREEGGE